MGSETEPDIVTRELHEGVALLTLNRPEQHNVWTIPLEERYFERLREAEADADVRVIVVTGAGRSFCPGMDSGALANQAVTGISTKPHLRQSMMTPTTIAKPVIAAINGACAGLGLIAALNCDMRFAATSAKFTTAFVKRGIMAEHGMAWTLPRLIGTSRALDLLLSGRVILGDEAERMGLVDRAVELEDLIPETMKYAKALAANSSPIAMGTIKRQVYQSWHSSMEESRTTAIRFWMGHLRSHPDFKEGINSYLDKRPPQFQPWDVTTPDEPAPMPTD